MQHINRYKQQMHQPFSSPQCVQKSQNCRPHQPNSHPIPNCLPFKIPSCTTHQQKIHALILRLRQLQLTGQELQQQNTDIMRSVESNGARDRNLEQQAEAWRKKFETLRADNDRKAMKYAGLVGGFVGIKGGAIVEEGIATKRQRCMSSRQLNTYPIQTARHKQSIRQQISLTKQQKDYLKHLQSQSDQNKKKRSVSSSNLLGNNSKNVNTHSHGKSYKNISTANLQILKEVDRNVFGNQQRNGASQNRVKKYSAKLDNGLVIHIIDSREGNHSIKNKGHYQNRSTNQYYGNYSKNYR